MFTLDEVIDHPGLQRAGAEEGDQGDHVFQAVGFELFDQLFHAAGFQLEHSGSFSALKQLEGFFIIQGDGGNIQRLFTFQGANLIHIS